MKTFNTETLNQSINLLAPLLPGVEFSNGADIFGGVYLQVDFKDAAGDDWRFMVYFSEECYEFMLEVVDVDRCHHDVHKIPSLKETLSLLLARHFQLTANI